MDKLSEAANILEKQAMTLPDIEFAKITARVTKLDYAQTGARLGIPGASRSWIELTEASKGGGKQWLAECVRSKKILSTETKAFVDTLKAPPKPAAIWSIMVLWRNEMDRQRYLSMILED